jgi:hypothetical protein
MNSDTRKRRDLIDWDAGFWFMARKKGQAFAPFDALAEIVADLFFKSIFCVHFLKERNNYG